MNNALTIVSLVVSVLSLLGFLLVIHFLISNWSQVRLKSFSFGGFEWVPDKDRAIGSIDDEQTQAFLEILEEIAKEWEKKSLSDYTPTHCQDRKLCFLR
jgi:hypothetical protein